MSKLLKKIKLLWSESQPRLIQANDDNAGFHVKLHNMLVGTLTLTNGIWTFEYSDDFKNQNEIVPLANFPAKDKVYNSKDLWPFFTARIPSKTQLQIKEDKTDIVDMLSRFGRRTVANPYELLQVD